MKKYLFVQFNKDGSQLRVIVENPKVEHGILYATKIGKCPTGDYYKPCSPVEFIASGQWTLTEYFGETI